MKIYKDIVQGSPEWFELRKGKMTASNAQSIGNMGKGLDTYINKLMAEAYSSGEPERFSSADTDRGNELEAQARKIYELENNVKIETVGFIEHSELVGCSPDGLIEEDSGVEIKCPKDDVYFKILLAGIKGVDSKYLWQIQMNLLITARKKWILIFYNPNFKKSMIVFEILPDEEKQRALVEGFVLGEKMINDMEKKIITAFVIMKTGLATRDSIT